LTARRDALVDGALAYAIPPVALLAISLIGALPSFVLVGLGGFATAKLWERYKKM
jgi:hypothetical protein